MQRGIMRAYCANNYRKVIAIVYRRTIGKTPLYIYIYIHTYKTMAYLMTTTTHNCLPTII